jgi:hypothetical protein
MLQEETPATHAAEPHVAGEAILYRLEDVGYEIRLDRAAELLAANVPERQRPARVEAQAIQIPNPPLTIHLGAGPAGLPALPDGVEFTARLYDFGVISLRARIPIAGPAPWSAFVRAGAALSVESLRMRFDAVRGFLLEQMRPAIVRAGVAPVSEEYVIFRVNRLEDAQGNALKPDCLDDERIARLLLEDARSLAPAARRDLLSPRFSYFEDDLAVLTWNAALVVEPVVEDTDVQYVLEFANAQLLELRYYDAVLDAELPRISAGSAHARRGFHLLGRRYGRLLGELQTRVADATEAVERVENALKVTDDVFLARIYAAALEIFRERPWRAGIERKMTILRHSYEMLNAESQTRRAEALELIIIALIALEIVLALWPR